MTTSAAALRRPVLADLVPAGAGRARGAAVTAALVLAGTALVAVLSQVAVPLPFTPVPLSLGTFGVLVVGAALGPARATASLGLYLLAGVAGVGWFAGGASGWQFASFGYLLGYVVAAAVVGALARRGADRSVWGTIGAMLAGNVTVYAFGVPWLSAYLGVDLPTALGLGVVPFLLGDTVKAIVAAVLLPSAWALVRRAQR
ncbi:biotin transporter BioY [Miniimonas sp. S16]|uniref:biotin transporter BioY n=1 Tax=Miniimonas sp. S16 TaxID=2171623 RepID=UPI001900D3C2|nr:biotin transporter BioY [Miniimonas sp. S16]